jgi:hypothetical protein
MLYKRHLVSTELLKLILLCVIIRSDETLAKNNVFSSPPRKSILKLSKGIEHNDNPTSRILPGFNKPMIDISNSHSNINQAPDFFCTQKLGDLKTLDDGLVCYCSKEEEKVIDISTGTYGWNVINQQPKAITKLYLFFCKYSIGNLVFKSLNLNALSELYIAESEYLRLHEDSLDFPSTNVNVTINTIGNLVFAPKLHPSVSTLILDNVKVNEFSTDDFVPHSVQSTYKVGNIVIKNSVINSGTTDRKTHSHSEVEVNSITFDNNTFDFAPRYQFINLFVKTRAMFSNMKLEASNENIIRIKADILHFENCTIRNWRPSAISATINRVIFRNTILQEPQKHALMDLLFLRNTSTLELINVTLDDPAQGTLVTKFPIVNFQNIFVQRCRCDLVHYLFTADPSIKHRNEESFTGALTEDVSKEKIETHLSEHIKCHPPNNPDHNVWVHPKEDCISIVTEKPVVVEKEVEKIDYKLIIGPLICVLVVATIIVTVVVRCSNQKEKKKVNLVNNWQFHAPKEIQLMDEDKQFVYVSSVSESPIFSAFEVDVEMRDFQQPDIVIDLMRDSLDPTTFPSTKLNHHSLDVVSRAGSFIIHEDMD